MMMRTKNRLSIFIGLCTAFALLACQPVIAIGWREGLFIFILIMVLIGPPVYRLIRRFEDFRKGEKTDRDHNP